MFASFRIASSAPWLSRNSITSESKICPSGFAISTRRESRSKAATPSPSFQWTRSSAVTSRECSKRSTAIKPPPQGCSAWIVGRSTESSNVGRARRQRTASVPIAVPRSAYMPSVEALTTDLEPDAGLPANRHVNPDLLASICHDLKAPLASIVMGAGFLRQVVSPDNASALRVVDAIRRASERMTQLIVSFSDLAKLEMHDLTLQIRPYDIEAIVRTAVEQFVPEATAQGVPVLLELGSDVPTQRLSCDRERVLQIFHHLTTCALRVVPESGTIGIRVDAEGAALARVELV